MFTWLQMKMLVRVGSKPGERRTSNFTPAKRKNIAEENALRPIVLARIDENCQAASRNVHNDRKMNSADRPQNSGADREPGVLHTITSSAPGRISSDLAIQAQDFAIHHHVHWAVEIEIDSLRGGARRQRMIDVRAGEKARRNAAADRSRPIGPQRTYSIRPSAGIGFGRDHHFAAGEFAVAEGEKQAAAAVPFVCVDPGDAETRDARGVARRVSTPRM